ncbi:MAG TPA: hypothetical protein VEV37_08350 [Bryobacteraceae bacterium]|nr:hypothetical protein [Bryobacteraceae bacterium]
MYSVYAHRGVSAMGAALEVLRNACVEGSEPTEVQMRDAMLYTMNHPPGIKVSDPVTIRFFKKETCEAKPTAQGYHCKFDVQVASANLGASMHNTFSMGDFYVDKETGRWNRRPPF